MNFMKTLNLDKEPIMKKEISREEAVEFIRGYFSLPQDKEPVSVWIFEDKNGEKWWRVRFMVETGRVEPPREYFKGSVNIDTGEIFVFREL